MFKSLTKNLGLKVFSILVAILLAYAVNSESNSSVVSLVVPIEIKNPPEGKVMVRPVRRSVQITMRGPSFIIGPVASSPPALRVKLPAKSDDVFPVTFKASDLTLPPTVEVIGIDPPDMDFVFESIEQREVRIEVPRIGQLPKQMTLERLAITPKTVIASGPKSEVAQIRSVETEPIDLREVRGSATANLALRVPGSQTTLSAATVGVAIEITMIPQERMIDSRPVELRAAPELSGLKLEPSRVMVVISGAPEAVAAVDPASVIPYVRIRELPEKDGALASVDVELPQGISLVKVEPRKVEIRKESGNRRPIRSKSVKPR